jgi:hypothetical protein
MRAKGVEELVVLIEDDGMWYPKMNPYSFKKNIVSICHYDALLACCEDGHLSKLINYHKYTIISFLGGWKTIHVIH